MLGNSCPPGKCTNFVSNVNNLNEPPIIMILITAMCILMSHEVANSKCGSLYWFIIFRNALACQLMTHLRQSLNASNPNFETQYGPVGRHILPSTLEILTMRPLAFLMKGSTLMVTAMTPNRFTLIMFLKSSTTIQSIGPDG